MQLLLPLPARFNRLFPVVHIHVNPLTQCDTTTPHRTARPQPHKFEVLWKAQKQRKRDCNNIVHKQIRPPAYRLQPETAQNRIRQRSRAVAELEHRQ